MASSPTSPRMRRLALVIGGVVTFLVFGGASSGGCVPNPFSFLKSSGATDPSPDSGFGDFATLSVCDSFLTYRTLADPVMQRMCTACHASGGRGAGKFLIAATTADEDSKIATNFAAVISKLDPEEPNVDSNSLLAHLNGTISHDITLDIAGDDYAALRQWVTEEKDLPCAAATPTL